MLTKMEQNVVDVFGSFSNTNTKEYNGSSSFTTTVFRIGLKSFTVDTKDFVQFLLNREFYAKQIRNTLTPKEYKFTAHKLRRFGKALVEAGLDVDWMRTNTPSRVWFDVTDDKTSWASISVCGYNTWRCRGLTYVSYNLDPDKIVKIAEECGLMVEWNGSYSNTIKVFDKNYIPFEDAV